MKNFKENFNFISNIFILILLFFGGLSYADTNGVWQFANDTRGGTFGGDEQGFTTNYTFINPVYFNLGLHLNGFSTFTQLNGNLLYANNVTIANQLTLTGVNCGVNSKLRTDAFGNVICSTDNVNDGVYNLATMKTAVSNDFHNLGGVDNVNDGVYNLATMKTAVSNDFHNLGGVDNVNDGVYNLATMKTAVSNDFHNLGGVDKDTWITTQTCGVGKILTSVGKNSKICVADTLNSVKNGVSWAEVSGKPVGFADNVDNVNDAVHNFATMRTAVNHNFHNLGGVDRVNDGVHNLATMRTAVNHNFHNLGGVDRVGITREIDPQVRTVISGKLCKGVAGGKIDCTSAAPSSGSSINYGLQTIVDNKGTGNNLLCPPGYVSRGFKEYYYHIYMYCVKSN